MFLPPWLLSSVLAGSTAILLVLLVRPLVRRTFGAQAAHALWLLVLIRIALPIAPPWAVVLPSFPAFQAAATPSLNAAQPSHLSVSVSVQEGLSSASPVLTGAPFPWALSLWLTGLALSLGLLTFRLVRAHRICRAASDLSDHPMIAPLLAELCHAQRPPSVAETAHLRSPALAGLRSPTILLPPDWSTQLNTEDLRLVLCHELGHLHRRDVLWQFLFELSRALQWFNPLVWFAARAARRDQELACDEWVLQRLAHVPPARYGEAILNATRLLSPSAVHSPSHALMAESRSGLQSRLRHLALIRPRRWWAPALALIVVGAILSFAACEKTPPAAPPTPASAAAKPSPAFALPAELPRQAHQIEISAKIVEISPELSRTLFPTAANGQQSILTPGEFNLLLQKLNDQKSGVQLLSAPRVTTKSGQKATVKIVREFPYPTEFNPGGDIEPLIQKSASTTFENAKPKQTTPQVIMPATPTAFETRNLGMEIESMPQITTGGRILCEITSSITEFLGFVNYGAVDVARETNPDAIDGIIKSSSRSPSDASAQQTGTINQPVFDVRRISTNILMNSGETIVLGGIQRSEEQAVSNGLTEFFTNTMRGDHAQPPTTTKTINRMVLVLITLTSQDNEGRSLSDDPPTQHAQDKSRPTAPATTPAPTSTASSYVLYGTPVPGKPGFVTSPYAPKAGYVDLRGFSPGTEVKCPYTGKMFRTP